jgi:hypothetical protein
VSQTRLQIRSRRGAASRLSGRRREILAMLLLMAKGYRILGFRLRTPQGEIDVLAAKSGCLVVVEATSAGGSAAPATPWRRTDPRSAMLPCASTSSLLPPAGGRGTSLTLGATTPDAKSRGRCVTRPKGC